VTTFESLLMTKFLVVIYLIKFMYVKDDQI
jgi:hypothetical protein